MVGVSKGRKGGWSWLNQRLNSQPHLLFNQASPITVCIHSKDSLESSFWGLVLQGNTMRFSPFVTRHSTEFVKARGPFKYEQTDSFWLLCKFWLSKSVMFECESGIGVKAYNLEALVDCYYVSAYECMAVVDKSSDHQWPQLPNMRCGGTHMLLSAPDLLVEHTSPPPDARTPRVIAPCHKWWDAMSLYSCLGQSPLFLPTLGMRAVRLEPLAFAFLLLLVLI